MKHPPLTNSEGAPLDPAGLLNAILDYTPAHQREGLVNACLACAGFNGVITDAAAPTGPFILPVPENVPWQSIEVHTLRWGNPDWMAECAPTMEDWCARHGLPLKVTTTWDPAYPDPKFCEIDMLRSFLAGDGEWMFFIDADTVIHPLAPRPHFPQPGFWIREDTHGRANHRWFAWCMEKFGRHPSSDYLYRNAGVWACDRDSARRMLAVMEKPYHEGIMEQDHWNWWISLAVEKGMPLRDLPHRWNRFPREKRPSWIFHIYSKAKLRHLLNFRAAGLLPDQVKRFELPAERIPDYGPRAIVWPYLSTAAEWDELWYSHRSVLAHWKEKEDWPLVLAGDRAPAWWPGHFVHAPSYEEAITISVQCAEDVILMNDDILMLADQSLADLARARHLGEMLPEIGRKLVSANVWNRGLGQVLMRCHHHGRGTMNFSTHTPYLFERGKSREILRRFGVMHKIPFETAYHNWHRSPSAPLNEAAENPAKLDGKLWFNPSFRQVTTALRELLATRYGSPP